MSIHELEKKLGMNDNYLIIIALFMLPMNLFLLINPYIDIPEVLELYDVSPNVPIWLSIIIPIFTIFLLVLLRFLKSLNNQLKFTAINTTITSNKNQDILDRLKLDIENLRKYTSIKKTINIRYDPLSNDESGRVRKIKNKPTIIITRGLLKLYIKNKNQALSIIAHEISHVELDDISSSNLIRWGLTIYFYLFIALFLLLLMYYWVLSINPSLIFKHERGGIITDSLIGGTLRIIPSTIIILTNFAVTYIYSYYYLLRREYVHDYRSAEITKNKLSLIEIFTNRTQQFNSLSQNKKILNSIKYFFRFHPTPKARLKRIKKNNPFFVDLYIYPIITGAFLLYFPILCIIILEHFTKQESIINLTNTIILCLITYFLFRSDIGRFCKIKINKNHSIKKIAGYSFITSFSGVFWITFLTTSLNFNNGGLQSIKSTFLYSVRGGIFSWINYFLIISILSSLLSLFHRKNKTSYNHTFGDTIFFIISIFIVIVFTSILLLIRHGAEAIIQSIF